MDVLEFRAILWPVSEAELILWSSSTEKKKHILKFESYILFSRQNWGPKPRMQAHR